MTVGRIVYRHPSGRLVQPVLHATTAKVYLADPATAARLSGSGAALHPADEQALLSAGLLVPEGTDEAAGVIEAGRVAAAAGRRTRGFVIMPTSYCNMACSYCGQEHRRGVTSAGHRDALVARVTAAIRSGRYDDVHVRWFGGEPLMGYAIIRDLSRRFIAAADEAGVGYSGYIVTNGALLDERKLAELHGACRVGTIEVTVDGPEAEHDASRVLKNGSGSFRHIVRLIAQSVRDECPQWRIRTNVGEHNAHLSGEFAAAMAESGLAHPKVSFYPAPIHSWGNDVSAVRLAAERMAAIELDWLAAYHRNGLTCALVPIRPVQVPCVAVTRHSEVVSPDGRVYSCTEQPLVPGFEDRAVSSLPVLAAGELRPEGEFDDWYDALDGGETGCRDCRILPLCGGACPKLWREGKPPCPPLKLNVAGRLDLFARAAGCEPVS
ncbi:radical SAM/SPASM domain-containing protein [Longispora albida]|uniref:radical SAM/SPASM domain-containing protein n=1 Tax=Longispora albida TaxID=203523 RepID=UPI00037CB436|nr:radical SAM protein [Longispora albida]